MSEGALRRPCQKYLFMFINILYFLQLSVSGMDISGRMQTLKADPRDTVVIDDQPHWRQLKNPFLPLAMMMCLHVFAQKGKLKISSDVLPEIC